MSSLKTTVIIDRPIFENERISVNPGAPISCSSMGERDETFDFSRRHSGNFGGGLDQHRGYVREGVDGDGAEGIDPTGGEDARHDDDQDSLTESECQKRGQH